MQQRHAVLGQQLLYLVEEGPVLRHADMLEHADRDDAVVTPGFLAVIQQLEAHAVSKAGCRGTALGHPKLLDREGQAGDVDAALLGEIERHAAPAAADIPA